METSCQAFLLDTCGSIAQFPKDVKYFLLTDAKKERQNGAPGMDACILVEVITKIFHIFLAVAAIDDIISKHTFFILSAQLFFPANIAGEIANTAAQQGGEQDQHQNQRHHLFHGLSPISMYFIRCYGCYKYFT
jgi:hypothetical protein